MLHDFLSANRAEIIARTRAKVATRSAPRATEAELAHGVPLFLDQLVAVLRREANTHDAIGDSGTVHGGALLRLGFTIAQVVRDYGDICQAVTELADEVQAPITIDEFHTLNRCLDDAIAGAVTEYSRLRERSQGDRETERLGVLAHELRNKLSAAMLGFEMLKSGRVGAGGSTGAVIERNMRGLRALIDRSMAEVRLEVGIASQERIAVAELVEEIELDACLEASAMNVDLTVAPVHAGLEVTGDRPLLAAAVINLLQNAFKFSHAHGHVTLRTTATADRVLFEIEDECGGLPEGKAEELFQPYTQRGADRNGLGLGLSISRRGVEASGGVVRVQNVPGKGCVFTIDLPRNKAVATPA
jgi:signal transduction histidine kinase